MAEIDEINRKITLKLVYYVPAQSGKTTTLKRLHNLLARDLKGEVMTMQNGRTPFFDLLPLGFLYRCAIFFGLRTQMNA